MTDTDNKRPVTPATQLRALLATPGMIRAPGVYDGITAKLAAQAGSPALYMTGAGTSASLGYPDFGLLTMSEMAANGEVIARSVAIPVIADADTGYGNELNVTRTIQTYERAGIAGLHTRSSPSAAAIWMTRRWCRATIFAQKFAPPLRPVAIPISSSLPAPMRAP